MGNAYITIGYTFHNLLFRASHAFLRVLTKYHPGINNTVARTTGNKYQETFDRLGPEQIFHTPPSPHPPYFWGMSQVSQVSNLT